MVPLRSCCQLKLQHSHGTRVSSCSLKVPDACSSLYLTDLLAEASFSKMREISPRKRPRKQRKRTSRNNTRGRTAEGFRGRVRYFIENLLGIKTTAHMGQPDVHEGLHGQDSIRSNVESEIGHPDHRPLLGTSPENSQVRVSKAGESYHESQDPGSTVHVLVQKPEHVDSHGENAARFV